MRLDSTRVHTRKFVCPHSSALVFIHVFESTIIEQRRANSLQIQELI